MTAFTKNSLKFHRKKAMSIYLYDNSSRMSYYYNFKIYNKPKTLYKGYTGK